MCTNDFTNDFHSLIYTYTIETLLQKARRDIFGLTKKTYFEPFVFSIGGSFQPFVDGCLGRWERMRGDLFQKT